MGVAALAALFQALGQAPAADSAARDHAVAAALSGCVEQAAAAALGRAPTPEEQRVVTEQVLADARLFVDSFRVLDEGEGGGVRFAFVEANVALGRLMRRLAPASPQMQTRLLREASAAVLVRGSGWHAVSVRAHGPVLVDGKEVGLVDRTAWGFGPSQAVALADAERRAEQLARGDALASLAIASGRTTTSLWLSVRGLSQPGRALSLRAALLDRLPALRSARLIRAGAGSADLMLETEMSAADLAEALESLALDGLALAADATSAGEVAARVLPP